LAPADDEPVTDGDAEAIVRARADIDAGRLAPHEEILSSAAPLRIQRFDVIRVQ